MSHVRTVLGDVRPETLGRVYAHEHVIIDRSYTTQIFPEILLPSVENAVVELEAFRRAGGGAMIDCMPCDAGRNILKLSEISRRSGVHLVAPTGLHRRRFYPEGHWRFTSTVEALSDLFTREIEEGIDAHDCAGPDVRRTAHPAGVIKLGSDGASLDEAERLAFEAGASAHRRTGAPVITHCEPGRGVEQVQFLSSRGVEPAHIVLSHTDREPDPAYHRSLFRTGAFVEYDRVFRAPLDDANPTLRLFVRMVREFPDQVMLGTDGARPGYWRSYGGSPGLDYLLGEFSDRARRLGVPEEALDRVFIANPARAYAFAR
ncbi:MAG TPA: aryldialkylphosphatase [Planctomycetota bacterium]|nr:aryldialkylphosphatase [Planctomycetota bacterium]